MLTNNLKLYIKGNLLTLTLPLLNRLLFLLIGLMFTAGIIYSDKSSPRLWIPILLALASFAGALYTETWEFDKSSSTMTSLRGLKLIPIFNTRKIVPFHEIHCFRYTNVSHNKGKPLCTFSVELTNSTSLEIERGAGKHTCETIKDNAAYIAVFCNKKLGT